MLRPIDASNLDPAIALLVEGFPDRPASFWHTALSRIQEFGENAALGLPIGHVLMDGDRLVGVILTPASTRVADDGRTVAMINISSWYIVPDHRWRALPMLRAVLKHPDAVFTDLTPTEDVQKLLRLLKFDQISHGITVQVLPLLAMGRSRGAVVHDLSDVPDGDASRGLAGSQVVQMLKSYRQVGCLTALLQIGDAAYPLAFKARTIRGLPAAMLIYCEDNAQFVRHLPAVARYLLKRGKLLALFDCHPEQSSFGLSYPSRGIKFARGGSFANRTDYAGSELCLFEW